MKYYLITYGCQMNKSDSERIAGFLENRKVLAAEKLEQADLVILNTCSVRQSAENRVFGLIKNLKKLPHRPKIAVTGCMASKDPKKLKDKVDLVFKIDNLPSFQNLLSKENNAFKNIVRVKSRTTSLKQKNYFGISPKYKNSFHAYVPVMTGCDNFCTYCVVPYARGREISRPPEEILCEIKNLTKKGYKAITLIGQNVNSYGKGLEEKIDFPKLLQKIEKLEGSPSASLMTKTSFWLWFITSHPKDMSDKLIKVIAKSKKICPYIHLPVQAGDNKILAKMNRGYTREKYLKLISKIKKVLPEASLSTDIIVGFPGETKLQFQSTCDLFKKVKFDMAYIVKYSPRPGTATDKLKDNVPLQEKKRRHQILDKLLRKIAYEKNIKLVGKTLEVLIETKKNGFYSGKTKTFKTVKIFPQQAETSSRKPKLVWGQNTLIGQTVKVKIKKALDFGLEGKLI